MEIFHRNVGVQVKIDQVNLIYCAVNWYVNFIGFNELNVRNISGVPSNQPLR